MSYIKGVGMTRFDIDARANWERVYECAVEALDSAAMSLDAIDAIFIANSEVSSTSDRQRHTASQLSSLFQKKIPIINSPGACGGGGVALWNALRYQKKTNTKNILVIGVDNLASTSSPLVTDEILMGGERVYEQTEGMIFPAINALVGQQYMMKYHVTSDDLALIAYKNHDNAFYNPKARFYNKRITLDMIKNSPMVASPLRLFDCSITCNGAAAVIVSTEKADIEIAGSAMAVSNLSPLERPDMTCWSATVTAAKEAYTAAGITPADLNIVEVHDAFTPVELIAYDDLGFSKPGQAVKLIKDGTTKINGALPVNTSGGLKAKGHPISPTGLSQIYEIVLQMRGGAGKRQIKKPMYGLAHNVGGAGSIAAVHILKNVS